MELKTLIPLLKSYKTIVVAGPQRSGTTIATHILAIELGYKEIDEAEFGVDNLVKFIPILNSPEPKVIQAPGLSSVLHLLKSPDVAVVFMLRNTYEIISSGDRIGWNFLFDKSEADKYFYAGPPRHSSIVKVSAWENYQKKALQERGFTLDYESMKDNPLWIDKSKRLNFHPKQIHESL